MSENKLDRFKFKGKQVSNGEWVEGDLIHNALSTDRMYIALPTSPTVAMLIFCEIDPKTLCQSTGITDMTGKLIYENDVISMDSWTPKEMLIRFIEGAFCLCFLEGKNEGEYCGDIHYVQHAGRKQATIVRSIHDS